MNNDLIISIVITLLMVAVITAILGKGFVTAFKAKRNLHAIVAKPWTMNSHREPGVYALVRVIYSLDNFWNTIHLANVRIYNKNALGALTDEEIAYALKIMANTKRYEDSLEKMEKYRIEVSIVEIPEESVVVERMVRYIEVETTCYPNNPFKSALQQLVH